MNASRRLNILPMLTPADKGDKRFGNAVLRGDGTLGHAHYAANRHDVGRIQFRGGAAPGVFSGGNRLQMSRIDASAIAAQMIELQSLGNRTDKFFIDPTVRDIVDSSACDFTIARLGQVALSIPATRGRINCVGCVDIGMARLADTANLRLASDHAPIVSSEEATRREATAAAATWKQYWGLCPELVISDSGASAAASVFRLREVSTALNALLGTIGVHVSLLTDVPRRRVSSAPLRLSVLSQQLYQAGGALCL